MVLLRRAPALVDAPRLDDAQQAVLDGRGPLLRVLGAPGTGKTTTAVELVVDRVLFGGLTPDECLLLTSTRVAAARLRERVTARLARTSTEPLARTHQAFGFGILRREAALRGDNAPRLISGPEQDVILRELLAGHAKGDATAPPWPDHVLVALDKRGFRAELRDLLMRAVEHGVEADRLAALGAEHDRPEWVAAAQVLREYDQVTAFSRPGAYDPAWILTAAADLLEDDPEALARVCADVRLVVVDDAQELTVAAARLLRVLAAAGPDLVLLGDPDTAVQTFRGADPRILATGWTDLGRPDPTGGAPPTCSCGPHTGSRPHCAGVSRTIATRIGALGGGGSGPPNRSAEGGVSRSRSCVRRPRRRRTSRRGCARPTSSTVSPGARWRSSSAARAATRRCGGSSWRTACPCCRRRARARSVTRWPCARCSLSSTPCSRSRWIPTTGSSPSGRSTWCCLRWGSATRSGCAGCAGCCGGRSWTMAAGGPVTSCWPRCG